MIVFFTRSTEHLAQKINVTKGKYLLKKFSDGELFVKLEQDVKDKDVFVVASTQTPAENIMELFFLLNALVRSGVKKINLFFTYFGYARQFIALPGEACNAQLICNILKKFPLEKIIIMHVHAADIMENFLNFENQIDFNFFCNVAKNYDVIAAPDKGAYDFAQKVAQECGKKNYLFKKNKT